ncbi:hypothetical protein soil367_16980 [Hydrocarboniclastica marina]|uniref:Uncharacterized protein n=1 Tax=Hydrocarboniclastica marina TaxID=2259620 RepID=A0A4P7XM12_9ALTE|nr:hypothetical protein soil367_16980 [Hydrocarboniclastica marina]
MPIDAKGSDLDHEIRRHKSFSIYDSGVRSSITLRSTNEIQWKKFFSEVTVTTDYRRDRSYEERWELLRKTLADDDFKAIRQVISLASIFANPLYIGLAGSLSSRYEQHASASLKKNNFRSRFEKYVVDNELGVRFDDLVFAALPVDFLSDEAESAVSTKELIATIEHILKNIIGPVFGDR